MTQVSDREAMDAVDATVREISYSASHAVTSSMDVKKKRREIGGSMSSRVVFTSIEDPCSQ